MATHLNTFQVIILEELNKLPLMYMDMWMQKQAWLSSNLYETIETVVGWEKQLVDENYVSREVIENRQRISTTPSTPWNINSIYEPTKAVYNETSKIKITQKGRRYLASLRQPEKSTTKAIEPLQGNENEKMIVGYLACLKGKWQGIKIMSDSEHKRLIEYTTYLVNNCKLPKNIKQIPKRSTIPFEFVRKTFHFIYLGNKKVPKTIVWVDLLFAVFNLQGTCTKKTTKDNFPTYRGDYDGTRDAIILD